MTVSFRQVNPTVWNHSHVMEWKSNKTLKDIFTQLRRFIWGAWAPPKWYIVPPLVYFPGDTRTPPGDVGAYVHTYIGVESGGGDASPNRESKSSPKCLGLVKGFRIFFILLAWTHINVSAKWNIGMIFRYSSKFCIFAEAQNFGEEVPLWFASWGTCPPFPFLYSLEHLPTACVLRNITPLWKYVLHQEQFFMARREITWQLFYFLSRHRKNSLWVGFDGVFLQQQQKWVFCFGALLHDKWRLQSSADRKIIRLLSHIMAEMGSDNKLTLTTLLFLIRFCSLDQSKVIAWRQSLFEVYR